MRARDAARLVRTLRALVGARPGPNPHPHPTLTLTLTLTLTFTVNQMQVDGSHLFHGAVRNTKLVEDPSSSLGLYLFWMLEASPKNLKQQLLDAWTPIPMDESRSYERKW